jgi:hypothetical protein
MGWRGAVSEEGGAYLLRVCEREQPQGLGKQSRTEREKK